MNGLVREGRRVGNSRSRPEITELGLPALVRFLNKIPFFPSFLPFLPASRPVARILPPLYFLPNFAANTANPRATLCPRHGAPYAVTSYAVGSRASCNARDPLHSFAFHEPPLSELFVREIVIVFDACISFLVHAPSRTFFPFFASSSNSELIADFLRSN